MKKKKRLTILKSQYCYVKTLHFITQSQLSYTMKYSTCKHKELKVQCVKKKEEYDKMECEYEKLRLTNRENAQKHLSYKRMHQEEQSENCKLKKKKCLQCEYNRYVEQAKREIGQ